MKLSIPRLAVSGILLVVGIAVMFVVFRSASSAPAQPSSTVKIRMTDVRFDVDTITARVGQPLTIQLENDDIMDHAFSIDELNVASDELKPRQSNAITFTPTKAGKYTFYCPLLGHAGLGMVGTLEVVS